VVNVEPLYLSPDFETRCPQGKKTTLYHKSRLETFSDYLNSDGIVSRLSLYSDTASEDPPPSNTNDVI
jgi:hypothetical protein